MFPTLEFVQYPQFHIISLCIRISTYRNTICIVDLTLRFDGNLTIFRQVIRSISILVIVSIVAFRSSSTIHKSLVTTAEYVTKAFEHIGFRTNLATIDMNIGAAEYVAFRTLIHSQFFCVGHITFTTPVVITTASTEDIAHHMTIP